MERNGIHIINLYKTAAKIEEANEALKKIAASGRKILFVATKKNKQKTSLLKKLLLQICRTSLKDGLVEC
jgi:ribosomal protein S2